MLFVSVILVKIWLIQWFGTIFCSFFDKMFNISTDIAHNKEKSKRWYRYISYLCCLFHFSLLSVIYIKFMRWEGVKNGFQVTKSNFIIYISLQTSLMWLNMIDMINNEYWCVLEKDWSDICEVMMSLVIFEGDEVVFI